MTPIVGLTDHQALPIMLSRRATRRPGLVEAAAPGKAPLTDLGTTYSMAQEVRWLDATRFAIGRWDGTLTIFHLPTSTGGPVITSAAVSPARSGVEMVATVTPDVFVSSLDDVSIAMWEKSEIHRCAGIPFAKLAYDPKIGVANSACLVRSGGRSYMLSGHSEGYLLVWELSPARPSLQLLRTIDVRSANPVPSPYPLKNVREVAEASEGVAVTGSEDGDICFVSVPDGRVLSRMRYNPSAERGINDLSVLGDLLLVANCSVGNADRNLWLYRITGSSAVLLDSKNLKKDSSAPQAFNFCVELARHGEETVYFAATEEGLLWTGNVENDRLSDAVTTPVSSHFGAALNFEPSQALLSVVGDNIHLFQLA